MSTMTSTMMKDVLPPKLYRVGEIVRYTGLSRQTVHNYTVMGLIREAEWTPGGHRLYDETVFPRLQQIQSLKESKNMMEIQRLLSEPLAGT
jgi:DNA-binding transcriptional MerR regulator